MEGVTDIGNGQYQVPGFVAPFTLLNQISTEAATSPDVFMDNVRANIKLPYIRLQNLPEFQKIKGKDKPIAIVGGGPSVKTQIEELRKFKTIIVAGSANDWLMENGIIPTYSAVCDPDPVSINYFKKLDTETKYLVATSCDPKIVEHFKGHQVVLWHCHSDDAAVKIKEIESNYYSVAGGCTVGLRCLSIAILFGYCNVHFFGFDSCVGISDKEHHAYEFATQQEEDVGLIHNIKLGKEAPGEKTYRCIGYQLAQAAHFKEFYFAHHNIFTPTFHGEGMLPDLFTMIKKDLEGFIEAQKGKVQ